MVTKEGKERFYAKRIMCKKCKQPARYGRRNLCERCYNIDNDEQKRSAGKICRIPGCERGIRMRGFCMSHYIKFIRNVDRKHWKKWAQFDVSGCAACGWEKAPCDYHHIIPKNHDPSNIVYLCPNCHRLAHRNLLDTKKLYTLAGSLGKA